MSEGQRRTFEAAEAAVRNGKWSDARGKLKNLLMLADGPSQFLQEFLEHHAEGPPPGWDGVIPLMTK